MSIKRFIRGVDPPHFIGLIAIGIKILLHSNSIWHIHPGIVSGVWSCILSHILWRSVWHTNSAILAKNLTFFLAFILICLASLHVFFLELYLGQVRWCPPYSPDRTPTYSITITSVFGQEPGTGGHGTSRTARTAT